MHTHTSIEQEKKERLTYLIFGFLIDFLSALFQYHVEYNFINLHPNFFHIHITKTQMSNTHPGCHVPRSYCSFYT